MGKLKIHRAHALSPEHARKAAEDMAARLSEEFDMEFAWEDQKLRFQRSDLDGHLILGSKDVVIDARLGFLLALMQPSIERAIHAHLDQIFGAATAKKKVKHRKQASKKK